MSTTTTATPIRFTRTDLSDGATSTMTLVSLPEGETLYSAATGREEPYAIEAGGVHYDLDGERLPSAQQRRLEPATAASAEVLHAIVQEWNAVSYVASIEDDAVITRLALEAERSDLAAGRDPQVATARALALCQALAPYAGAWVAGAWRTDPQVVTADGFAPLSDRLAILLDGVEQLRQIAPIWRSDLTGILLEQRLCPTTQRIVEIVNRAHAACVAADEAGDETHPREHLLAALAAHDCAVGRTTDDTTCPAPGTEQRVIDGVVRWLCQRHAEHLDVEAAGRAWAERVFGERLQVQANGERKIDAWPLDPWDPSGTPEWTRIDTIRLVRDTVRSLAADGLDTEAWRRIEDLAGVLCDAAAERYEDLCEVAS